MNSRSVAKQGAWNNGESSYDDQPGNDPWEICNYCRHKNSTACNAPYSFPEDCLMKLPIDKIEEIMAN